MLSTPNCDGRTRHFAEVTTPLSTLSARYAAISAERDDFWPA
jgi:hypothetical protein